MIPLIGKELWDALRNRWLQGYAVILGVLGLAAAWVGLETTRGLALQAFGRTTATLMNLGLLLAPLMAVMMGAAAVAGERDRGTLEHLLAQPLRRAELLLGKYLGLLLALAAATWLGFAPPGVLVAVRADLGLLPSYLLFPLLATALVAVMLALGLLISVASARAVQAQGLAVFLWFLLVLLYDLLLLGTLSLGSLPPGVLAALLVANPVDATRVLAILALEPDLYLLGPAGALLVDRLGTGGTAALLLGALAAWGGAALGCALLRFQRPLRRQAPDPEVRHRGLGLAELAPRSLGEAPFAKPMKEPETP